MPRKRVRLAQTPSHASRSVPLKWLSISFKHIIPQATPFTPSTMPVTFTVASHPANPVQLDRESKPLSAKDLLNETWGRRSGTLTCKELLQSSLSLQPPVKGRETIIPRANGFVDTVIEAYNNHHHLVLRCVSVSCVADALSDVLTLSTIRPDDVWIAILSQCNA